MTDVRHSWKVDWPTSILASFMATLAVSVIRFPIVALIAVASVLLILSNRLQKRDLRRVIANLLGSLDDPLSLRQRLSDAKRRR